MRGPENRSVPARARVRVGTAKVFHDPPAPPKKVKQMTPGRGDPAGIGVVSASGPPGVRQSRCSDEGTPTRIFLGAVAARDPEHVS